MNFLVLRFFSTSDLFLVPICLLIMFGIIRNRANACKDPLLRPLYYKAFYFKMVCVFVYTLITEFYFNGGDTGLYYQGTLDLRHAVADDPSNWWLIAKTNLIREDNPLAPYFLYDNYAYDISINYMRSAANFFVPRLGLIPAVLFFNSYLCISICFSMFALGGGIRIFKTFYHFYPKARREIALSALFLPSVGFWSASLLKDPICYAGVGFALYGVLNVFFLKRKIIASIIWILISGYLLYYIKTYIFLVFLLAMIIWVLAATNKVIKDQTLKRVFSFGTLVIGIVASLFLLRYLTSTDALRQFQFENLLSNTESQRNNYGVIDAQLGGSTSYYTVNTSNPFLLIVNSIGSTFFRPFPWEIKSAAAILSAIEAFGFLLLTIYLFIRRGLFKPFQLILKDQNILMATIFALIFAIGVGASTANFGTLSRYKIPCMPFYLLALLITYRYANLSYPRWFSRLLGYK